MGIEQTAPRCGPSPRSGTGARLRNARAPSACVGSSAQAMQCLICAARNSVPRNGRARARAISSPTFDRRSGIASVGRSMLPGRHDVSNLTATLGLGSPALEDFDDAHPATTARAGRRQLRISGRLGIIGLSRRLRRDIDAACGTAPASRRDGRWRTGRSAECDGTRRAERGAGTVV